MKFLQDIVILVCLLTLSLYGMDVSKEQLKQPLLADSQMYIDHTRKVNINTIDKQTFEPVVKDKIGFGYAPDFDVWVKIELKNPSDEKIKKVIEYTNPLTTHIDFYDAKTKALLYNGGISAASVLHSINPTFPVTLQAHESKIYYLKAYSSVTTLIVGLTLWDMDAFYQYESKHQFTLALFFGAMGIIILYNLFISFSVREKIYLYYVIAFAGIIFHHLFYKGLAGLYFLSPKETLSVVQYAAFIVAVPTVFIALFTKNILELEQYPKLTKFLNLYLFLFVVMTIVCYLFDYNNLKNLFSVLALFLLFFITLYALFHHNRPAKFIMIGWVALLTSGLLMYLSSVGYYDIFDTLPYYVELSLLMETLLFSLILADRLKQLRFEKIETQNYLIEYKGEEENRLKRLVDERTSQLQVAVQEKDLLLQELNHRVKNSIQTIVSFLRLQIDETDEHKMQQILMQIENRIISISHLYRLLYSKHDIAYISAEEYFDLLIKHIETALHKEHINITLNTDISLDSETAVYCGFIINEAVTNALQHAFMEEQSGHITIALMKYKKTNILIIEDDGCGFDTSLDHDSLGLVIIESLATYQLNGQMSIVAEKGTKSEITWEDKHA